MYWNFREKNRCNMQFTCNVLTKIDTQKFAAGDWLQINQDIIFCLWQVGLEGSPQSYIFFGGSWIWGGWYSFHLCITDWNLKILGKFQSFHPTSVVFPSSFWRRQQKWSHMCSLKHYHILCSFCQTVQEEKLVGVCPNNS